MLFTSADVKSYLISGMWSHQGHLVIPSPEQSPNRIQLSLQNTPKITHSSLKYSSAAFTRTHLYGGVPPPLLRAAAGRLSRLRLVRFKLLIRHLNHGILGFVELGTFLGGALLPPPHLKGAIMNPQRDQRRCRKSICKCVSVCVCVRVRARVPPCV